MVAVLIVVTIGGVRIGAAIVARHRAQTVADLAALAAAAHIASGPAAACAQSQQVAQAMRATLIGCRIEQLDVVVTAAVAVGGAAGTQALALARAGPVGPG